MAGSASGTQMTFLVHGRFQARATFKSIFPGRSLQVDLSKSIFPNRSSKSIFKSNFPGRTSSKSISSLHSALGLRLDRWRPVRTAASISSPLHLN
jgi:hypothetical protein